MLFGQIQPYVRLAHQFSDSAFIKKQAISTDNRLFYVLEGSGEIFINRKSVSIRPGCALLLPRGTCYHLPKFRATLIGINFDYFYNEQTAKQLLHPILESQVKTELTAEAVFEDVAALQAPLLIEEAESVYPKLAEMCDVFEKQKRFSDRICSGLLIATLAELLQLSAAPQQSENLINTIIEYISKNYAHPLANTTIGKKFGYHPNHINRLFLKQTGMSMHQYIINYRLSQALTKLCYTKASLTDISAQCGFSDYAYFSRFFKSRYGISPTEYRKTSQAE